MLRLALQEMAGFLLRRGAAPVACEPEQSVLNTALPSKQWTSNLFANLFSMEHRGKENVLTMRGEYRSLEEAERMESGRDAIHLAGGLVATAIVLAMIVVGLAVA
jgi:hypothetical protein